MDLGLKDRVVFITGASGGIGRALAELFAAEGARLALHAHSSYEALRTHAQQRWEPERVLALQGDIAQPADVQAAMEATVARFGRVDICVANAGIWPEAAERLDEMTPERLRRTLEINLLGAIWTARAFMGALERTGPRTDGHGASLTFIGSTAGRFGEKGHVDYSISKVGLYGLVRTLKNEIVALDPYARVNMVEPGWTATPMATAAIETPGTLGKVLRTMPMQQIARAEDIAQAVLFFSSGLAARHVSGEVLTVAGGMEGRVQWESSEINEDDVRRRLN